jgi:uncharacterized damage-inducible protein DinB
MSESAVMLGAAVAAVMERDLAALQREVEAYSDEADLWRVIPGLPNSAGTLALHLAGNLQHFIGRYFADTGYVRDRPAEFSRRNVPRAELLRDIEAAREAVRAGLSRLTAALLQEDYPEPIAGMTVATGEYLVHLATHLTYHLGQIDYHRRVVTGNSAGVGAVRPAELKSARAAGQSA